MAIQFESKILFETGNKQVNVKSMMGMMSLGLDLDRLEDLTVVADGADEEEGKNAPYTSADIRFVKKGKYLYAHIMKWPSDGKIQIKSLATGSPYCKGEIEKVELLGGGKAKFRRTSKGLLIDLPKDKTPNPISLVLKITNR